ncbi:hypothetical protein AALB81_18200 [Lachnospiraceae bacterium 48-33]
MVQISAEIKTIDTNIGNTFCGFSIGNNSKAAVCRCSGQQPFT